MIRKPVSDIEVFSYYYKVHKWPGKLTGDEGLYLPKGKLLCLLNYKTIKSVHVGQLPNLINNWADTSLHLLLLKCSIDSLTRFGENV